MRLTAIRLAGFKSFVDRTQLQLGSNLTAVVGPNGCGKSNLIDAVRWVLGESSARQLRGTSLEDVIFNGSRTRKPVGRASIELVFDNSDQKLGGQWGAYAEIAVRRELTREGQSVFYINSQRCRRKDVTELFLGTGLGPRSNYAIIEQGTISRLVEAQPEDLRQMLEEAAGVSRYKEKRRETETRIRHTRENLERLGDLIVEIEERLVKLKRQVSAARRYKELREEQRQQRAAQFGLRWRQIEELRRSLQQRLEGAQQDLDQRNKKLADGIAALRTAEDDLAQAETHRQATDEQFYRSQAEQNRLEQELRHREELRSLREREVAELEQESRQSQERLEAARRRHLECDANLSHVEQRLQQAAEQEGRANSDLAQVSEALQQAQSALLKARAEAEEPHAAHAREQARQEQLMRQEQALVGRLGQLASQIEGLKAAQPRADMDAVRSAMAQAEAGLRAAQEEQEQATETLSQARRELAEQQQRAQTARSALSSAQARLKVLQAEQERSLGKDDAKSVQQLAAQGAEIIALLGESLQVPSGRERAAEAILGTWLTAPVLRDAPGQAPVAEQSWLLAEVAGQPEVSAAASSMAANVVAPPAILSMLAAFEYCEDYPQAQARVSAGAAACVTAAGELLWPGAVRGPDGDAENSVLLRQKALAAADAACAQATAEHMAADERQKHAQQQLIAAEAGWSESGRKLGQARQMLAERQQECARIEGELERYTRRLQDLNEDEQARSGELEKLRDELASVGKAKLEHAQKLEQARAAATQAEQSWREIQERNSGVQRSSQSLRQELSALRSEKEELAAQRAAAQSAVASLTQGLEQTNQGIARAREALHIVQGEESGESRLAEVQARHRTDIEARAQAQSKLQHCTQRRNQLRAEQEQLRTACDAAGDALQETRLERERLASRQDALSEQMQEFGLDAVAAQAAIQENQSLSGVQQSLEDIERKLGRLGAVNLAAVDEFNEESARAEDLRRQDEDLKSALEQLETAMAQIDRETRAMFRKTYNAVNEGFKTRFPRLFGGGEAGLELIGDDVLSGGVRVMARPPGKRNASIALLSGGEKALTAVALVFALFELNPAPFCMLDEVDAPLDDANVVRFCEVVREMSAQVQFIVVTHNKVTMEMADALHGVTMQEAGVSRLVGVDVSAAVAMTQESA